MRKRRCSGATELDRDHTLYTVLHFVFRSQVFTVFGNIKMAIDFFLEFQEDSRKRHLSLYLYLENITRIFVLLQFIITTETCFEMGN